jgi:hypothetical protein
MEIKEIRKLIISTVKSGLPGGNRRRPLWGLDAP